MAEARLPEFSVRLMKQEEIPKALEVWRETGLVEGTHTVDTWYNVDPKGFYIAVNDSDGEVYGVCAGIIQPEDDLAFIGLYAVREAFRGMGVGKMIWKAMMEHVGDLNAGLNSVPEHLHTYRDLAGFRLVSSLVVSVHMSENLTPENLIAQVPGVSVLPVDEELISKMIDYDAEIHGRRREKLVRLSSRECDSLTLVAVRGPQQDICGYGIVHGNIQKTALGGPVYAKTKEVAELLLRRLVEDFPQAREEGLTMAVINKNEESLELAKKLGLKLSVETPRCYTKKEVDADFSHIFAQHSMNFSAF